MASLGARCQAFLGAARRASRAAFDRIGDQLQQVQLAEGHPQAALVPHAGQNRVA